MKYKMLIGTICILASSTVFAATQVSIDEAVQGCTAAGIKMIGQPVQSELKKQTSLIGMAYLNYIYQNDLKNEHYCQSMLLMKNQVPAGTENPYLRLFEPAMASSTLQVLEDIQLSFDYAINRSHPSQEKIAESVKRIQDSLHK